MVKKLIIVLPVVIILGGLVWYWFGKIQPHEQIREEAVLITPTEVVKSDEQLIKEALLAKHPDWKADEVAITVSQNDGKYAKGGAGPATPGPGAGLWFAEKTANGWQIVYDGNGIALCSDLAAFPDYPAELLSACYDNTTGKMVDR